MYVPTKLYSSKINLQQGLRTAHRISLNKSTGTRTYDSAIQPESLAWLKSTWAWPKVVRATETATCSARTAVKPAALHTYSQTVNR